MSQYDIYNQFRNDLLKIAQDQLVIIHGLKLDEVQTTGKKIGETIESLIDRLNSSQFRVLLVGVFNSGKTTFINALIGERLLPTAKVPATAVLCRILYGEPNEKKITLYPKPGLNAPNDGKPFDIKIEQLREYITIDHEKPDGDAESPYDRMEMYWPLPLCQNGIELIDSVGLDDPASRDKITMDYLSKADAVLFLMPCSHSCGGKDMAAIQGIRTMRFTSPFFILTHADSLDDEDDGGASVRAYVKKHLVDKTDLGEKGILYVNSLGAITAKIAGNEEKIKKTGIREIESALENFLIRERGRSKIFINLFSLQEQNHLVAEAIRLRDGMLRQSVDELKEKFEEIKVPLSNLKKQKDNLLDWTETTINKIVLATYDLSESYSQGLPDKIEDWGQQYKVEAKAGWVPRKSTITPIVEEVTNHLRMKIEEDISLWNENHLKTIIEQGVESIEQKITQEGRSFTSALDHAKNIVMPNMGTTHVTGIAKNEQPELWERVVGATAFVGINFVAGGVGMVHGVKAMVANFAIQLVTAIVIVTVSGTFAWPVIAAALLAGGGHALAKSYSVADSVKKKVCQKLSEELRAKQHESAIQIRDQVRKNLMEGIYSALKSVLDGDISSLENEITTQIEERNKASFDIETERQTLEMARTENVALQQRLSRFADEVMALP